MTVVLSPMEELRGEVTLRAYLARGVSDDGASLSALPSPQAAQSPEEAAEALRLLSEAQHGHQAVIESINGEAAGDDELDD